MWHRPGIAVVFCLVLVAAPYRADEPQKPPELPPPPKPVEYKGLPGIKWQIDTLFGPFREFTPEFLGVEEGILKWKLVANKPILAVDLLEIAEAQRLKDSLRRETGN